MTTYHSSYRRGNRIYEVDAGDGQYTIRCQGSIVAHSEELPLVPSHNGVSDDIALMIFAMDAVRRISSQGRNDILH